MRTAKDLNRFFLNHVVIKQKNPVNCNHEYIKRETKEFIKNSNLNINVYSCKLCGRIYKELKK